jgi:sphinganine-1-phosphate aldolase
VNGRAVFDLPSDVAYGRRRRRVNDGCVSLPGWVEHEEFPMRTLPSAGWTQDQIDRGLAAFVDIDPPRDRTRLSIGVHYVSDEIQQVLQRAHNLFAPHNAALSPRPGTREMEDEVLAISGDLLAGGRTGAVTTMSASGTESSFNALYAAREWARATKPHVIRPKVVTSMSAQGAFTKVCRYLDLQLVRGTARPHPPHRFRRRRCARRRRHDLHRRIRTRLAVRGTSTTSRRSAASRPSTICGSTSDATVGGFVAPFAAAVGEPIPPWDLSVPGVTSLAADLGTWAYGMKAASVVVWRDREHQAYASVTIDDWPIRTYETVGFAGSRTAGPVAAAWAVLHHLGRDGYELLTRHLMDGKRLYAERLAMLPGVELVEPGLVNLNFRHRTMPVDAIVSYMADRGWTHYTCDEPELVSIYLDASAVDVMDDYLADLADVLRGRQRPPAVGAGRPGDRRLSERCRLTARRRARVRRSHPPRRPRA